MKHKSPVGIGYRMIEELYRLYPNMSDRQLARMLSVSPTMISAWKTGVTPSANYLAALLHMGGDISWVLTGGARYGR
jgi:transcriptional regulator with XRE-family HTH domain